MNNQDSLKEALKKYNKNNYHVQTIVEYQAELDSLLTKVKEYVTTHHLTIDVVVPILRGGNIPATYLAYLFDVLTTIVPVQYKYFFKNGKCELRRLLSVNKGTIRKVNPTILLVEGNHCYGNQAKYAAKDLKAMFPQSRIIYAASNMDYNYQDVVKDAEVSIYGKLTNCCKELSESECKKLGIESKQEILFPWEKIDEEWEIIELKQHAYNNVDQIISQSQLLQEFDLG